MVIMALAGLLAALMVSASGPAYADLPAKEPGHNNSNYPNGSNAAGDYRVLVIPCKWTDQSGEPQAGLDRAEFLIGAGNPRPSLDHYYNEASGGLVGIANGSRLLDKWYTSNSALASDYDDARSGKLGEDCPQAVVDSGDMSATELEGFDIIWTVMNGDAFAAFGKSGDLPATPSKVDVGTVLVDHQFRPSTVTHEFGHVFGLTHISSEGFNGPCPTRGVDDCANPWAQMAPSNRFHFVDRGFGPEPVHFTSFSKDQLGWFDADERVLVDHGQTETVSLVPLSRMTEPGVKMIRARIAGISDNYSIEARIIDEGTYDDGLAGLGKEGVVIHRYRVTEFEPILTNDTVHGVLGIGDTFSRDGLTVTVTGAAANGGFVVEVSNSSVPVVANDDFADATVLRGLPAMDSSPIDDATLELEEPISVPCGADATFVSHFAGHKSLWWQWTAEANEVVRVTAELPQGLPAIEVFEARQFHELGDPVCDRDAGVDGGVASVEVDAKAGQRYFVRVHDWIAADATGVVELSIDQVPTEPAPEPKPEPEPTPDPDPDPEPKPDPDPDPEPTVPRCFGKRATIVGTNGADTLVGTDGDDVIVSLGGHDVIDAGKGNDLICSGNGNDAIDAGPGDDKVRAGKGKDKVRGGDGDDTLIGDGGRDKLFGDAGNDFLKGSAGNDRLKGSKGDDRCKGGKGKDTVHRSCESKK